MTPLTVACVYVHGEYPYTVDYVVRLRDMVNRWCDRPYRFVCLTDRPSEVAEAGIEALPVAKLPGFAPWTKLELFNPARAWVGRMLYFDLDTLIVDSLATLIDTPATFVITSDPSNPRHRARDGYGRSIVRRFNSSVMAWDGGTHTDLYTDWTPAVAHRLSGDQDWIGERRPDVATWPREWFPRISELGDEAPSEPARVVLVKVPKNHEAVSRWSWVAPLWGAA